MAISIVFYFFQGDKPRFFHLNGDHVYTPKSIEYPEKSDVHISDPLIENDNEQRRKITSSNIMINNIKKYLMDMEKESNIEENMILQGITPSTINSIKKKYREDILKGVYNDIQNGNVPKQQITSPEMMNKYVKETLMKMEIDGNNQEDMILQKINPSIEDVIRQKMLSKISNRIHGNF